MFWFKSWNLNSKLLFRILEINISIQKIIDWVLKMDVLIFNIIIWIEKLTFQFWNLLFNFKKTYFIQNLISEFWIVILES
jgi:hypothetical protein